MREPFVFLDDAEAVTCQACGGEHALRGGKVARHHYASNWRMKSGWCPGSGHPPLEMDTALTEQLLSATMAEIAALRIEVAQLDPDTRKPSELNKRWHLRGLYGYWDWLSAQLEYVGAPVVPGGTLRYRAFEGTIELDAKGVFGRALEPEGGYEVHYRAATLDRIVRAFRRAIDAHLILAERGRPPAF